MFNTAGGSGLHFRGQIRKFTNRGLAQAEHALYQVLVCRVHEGGLTEVALARLALLGQQVALESLVTADLAGTSDLERLLRAAVGLHLRHGGE